MTGRPTFFYCVLAVSLLTGCFDSSAPPEPTPFEEGILIVSVDGGHPDIPLLESHQVDASRLPPQEYRDLCWRSQFWHCPPFNEIWRVEVVIDTCNEAGAPCTPEEVADPSCQWRIVSEGECDQFLECDPADTSVSMQPCEDSGSPGQQEVRCHKGGYQRGPCLPCEEELCDSRDNDCDGQIDEGAYECANECGVGEALCVRGELAECDAPTPLEEVCDLADNDCDGSTDEGQLNVCGGCGPVPTETCDGIDNDCDGNLDEDLLTVCESVCGSGVQVCYDGAWSACSAPEPREEACDLLDNDCDGRVDEGEQCACPPPLIGALLPCGEPPLACGRGFRTCECVGANCASTAWTECRAPCVVLGQEPCDPSLGTPTDELCNAYDDNCNNQVDEDLTRACYSGPADTSGVGECHPGQQACVLGQWGGVSGDLFVAQMCLGESTPSDEICNALDDNCDGSVEEELLPTDVVFIVDLSGSMREEILAVQIAMAAFSARFEGSASLRWGLIAGPVGLGERLVLVTPLVPFANFIPRLAAVREEDGSLEMLKDALYLSVRGLAPFGVIPPEHLGIAWGLRVGESSPPLEQFTLGWRPDADRVIIVFTDEEPQSYLLPLIPTPFLAQMLAQIPRLSVHVFSGNIPAWADLAVRGGTHHLTPNHAGMFTSLMGILDEEICRDGQ
jgi:hypothetical protein